VQRLCPRYEQYEFLYRNSIPLQQSLCTFYASLIRFQNPNGLWLAKTAQYQGWLLSD
jgi:hypothetical protein